MACESRQDYTAPRILIQRTEALAMHAAERLDTALALARRLGYNIRLECLYGQTGGYCEIQGQKWLFVDLTLSPQEQLEQVVEALRSATPQEAIARAA
jgi:hypothetical protein